MSEVPLNHMLQINAMIIPLMTATLCTRKQTDATSTKVFIIGSKVPRQLQLLQSAVRVMVLLPALLLPMVLLLVLVQKALQHLVKNVAIEKETVDIECLLLGRDRPLQKLEHFSLDVVGRSVRGLDVQHSQPPPYPCHGRAVFKGVDANWKRDVVHSLELCHNPVALRFILALIFIPAGILQHLWNVLQKPHSGAPQAEVIQGCCKCRTAGSLAIPEIRLFTLAL